MKQRSAMLVAAGLVVALALAGLGLVMGMTGPSADAKAPEHSRKPPIVHTTTRTITVHKQGTATSGGAATTTTMGTTATGFAESTGGSDDQFESSSDDSSEMQSGSEIEDSGTSSPTSSSFNEGSDD